MTAPELVLAEAAERAGLALGFTSEQMVEMLGLDASCFHSGIDPKGTAGEKAIMLIQIYLELGALVGNAPDLIKGWMMSFNQGTMGIPSEQVQTTEGMLRVLSYLETIRGH